MAAKDYYLILGVPRSESPSGIRARFRDLVRTRHPDVVGARGTSAFQEITEAYEILADPAARRLYNAELARREGPPAVDRLEPLADRRRDPASLIAEPHTVRPSLEALVDRLFRNFTGVGVPKAERPESLTVEVVLTPEEAGRGVVVPVGVPALDRCPDCGGAGHVWSFPCRTCGAQGLIPTERIIGVTIPPLSRPGAVIEGPLHGLGIRNLYLRLLVSIA
jgi:DnaJ-class molecular chaperone